MKYIKKFKTDEECLQSEAWSPTVTLIKEGCDNEDGLCIGSIGEGIIAEYKEDNEIISLKPNYTMTPLTIEALEDGDVVFSRSNTGTFNLKYRINNNDWSNYGLDNPIRLNKGDTLQFKGNNDKVYPGNPWQCKFIINFQVNIYGNINSLLTEDLTQEVILLQACFEMLFYECTGIISAKNLKLPVTNATIDCYRRMFYGCTSLVEAPELPATTLADRCYEYMFSGCTSLIKVPKLPTTTLADSCYSSMFSGCTSLIEAPELPATTLVRLCYERMFSGCTSLNHIKVHFTTWSSGTGYWLSNVSSSGTFECRSSLSIKRGKDYIPTNWNIVTF